MMDKVAHALRHVSAKTKTPPPKFYRQQMNQVNNSPFQLLIIRPANSLVSTKFRDIPLLESERSQPLTTG